MVNIEKRDRKNYYEAIEKGDEGDDTAFVNYISSKIIDQHTFRVSNVY